MPLSQLQRNWHLREYAQNADIVAPLQPLKITDPYPLTATMKHRYESSQLLLTEKRQPSLWHLFVLLQKFIKNKKRSTFTHRLSILLLLQYRSFNLLTTLVLLVRRKIWKILARNCSVLIPIFDHYAICGMFENSLRYYQTGWHISLS